MTPDAVDRDAEELRVVVAKLVEDLVVDAHLVAAHRAPVGGVERQDHRLTAKVRERELLMEILRRFDALAKEAL